MRKLGQPLTDEKWQAIVQNDTSYDHQFIYAVESTGIFCRPSCKSRPPKREHVRIFDNAQQALAASFRPCKRCKPLSGTLPEDEWVEQIAGYIEAHYTQKLTLDILADVCHGSPYHLHRTFKRVKGVTPAFYIQQKRIDRALEYLLKTDQAISEVALKVGMGSTSYFITVFKKNYGTNARRIPSQEYKLISSEVLNHEIDK
ncbi:methylphosphotriester-DNA--protein-cysteine methyltransferase family protein [Paenibacillus lentus]|uniref:Methylphosphotriester-DNA--protein-cysteine methyltransferase family protein n=1 Tax=Paenibacillus lentus TaxID=1338368 RepID=A0A3S8S1X3_9BACL|nr:bifunctional transcriptional activator/DNA repair enzyme AdaA [Paenibacillus lentus]AZK49089.1 methylphosphotriester-DNA--protein-cysteine methyltransferase family protein [Paenibacillus lentus]